MVHVASHGHLLQVWPDQGGLEGRWNPNLRRGSGVPEPQVRGLLQGVKGGLNG